MKYSESEIRQYVAEEDVKFLRMTFFDLTGNQKNMSILPDALDRAFSTGIAFDASAIPGFGDELRSDLFLQPDTSTLCLLPWRPDHGRVARLFCRILRSDGTPFEGDSRALLQKAVDDAAAMGVSFAFGSEMEFYLPYNLRDDFFKESDWNNLEEYPMFLTVTWFPNKKMIRINE